jgi:glucose-6-phosphate isomerase
MTFSFQFETQLNEGSSFFKPDFREKTNHLFTETIKNPEIGFFQLAQNKKIISASKNIFNKYKHKKTFVQIGIGGSSLGPEMIITALRPKENDVNFIFLNNIDSEEIADQLYNINLEESLFYVVSKSGGTAETNAAFCIVLNLLNESGVSQNDYSKYFAFCTDPVRSDLKDLAKEWQIDCLDIPSNIGGRFSALTPAGLLPALFANIDIEELFSGANEVQQSIENELKSNEGHFHRLTSSVLELHHSKDINQTVIMPYSSKLRDLSFWFVQLWAESLGKVNKEGRSVGLTPIPSYGATDQHSQMQLFMEGPSDKLIFFIEVLNKNCDFPLKNSLPTASGRKLNPYTLNQLMDVELKGTLRALKEKDRAFINFQIQKNDAFHLGGLIMLFESLTAVVGKHLEINPFDQPGVENGKKYAFELLSKL